MPEVFLTIERVKYAIFKQYKIFHKRVFFNIYQNDFEMVHEN